MKKIIILILYATLLSCSNWEKDKNGNEYYTRRICLHSHVQPVLQNMYLNGRTISYWNYTTICDAYRLDTIWKENINSKKK
jgi:hypothetical protein